MKPDKEQKLVDEVYKIIYPEAFEEGRKFERQTILRYMGVLEQLIILGDNKYKPRLV
jgi:hypothetical protein